MNPPVALVLTPKEPLLPATTLPPVGALSVNMGVAFTVNWKVAVRVSESAAFVPVTVIVTVPRLAPAVAVSVSVPFTGPPATLALVPGAVTPGGNPLATRSTKPVKPFNGVTVTVWLPLLPAVIV